jgi:hypothetical protein
MNCPACQPPRGAFIRPTDLSAYQLGTCYDPQLVGRNSPSPGAGVELKEIGKGSI